MVCFVDGHVRSSPTASTSPPGWRWGPATAAKSCPPTVTDGRLNSPRLPADRRGRAVSPRPSSPQSLRGLSCSARRLFRLWLGRLLPARRVRRVQRRPRVRHAHLQGQAGHERVRPLRAGERPAEHGGNRRRTASSRSPTTPRRRAPSVGKHRVFVQYNAVADASRPGVIPGEAPKLSTEWREFFTKYGGDKSTYTVEITKSTGDLKIELE